MLELENLSVTFATAVGNVQAVRGVSLRLEPGKTLAIVGESGSGKSVMVQSIMHLLPKTAQVGGKILWNGRDIAPFSDREMQRIRGKEIGMIFQDPMTSLNPTMKIGHQIAEVLIRHQKFSARQALAHAVELLGTVGIPDPKRRANSYPHEFSGGMRQRAVIAIAIACSPQLMIADEPTTALDVTVQAQILDLLRDLQRQLNSALLLITHDLAVVSEVADEVAVMYAGKVAENGPVHTVLMKSAHPYTKGLLGSRPRNKDDKLTAIPGSPPDLLNPPAGCAFAARCPYAMQICTQEMPPSFATENQKIACWLLHPQAEGRQQWNSYNYGT